MQEWMPLIYFVIMSSIVGFTLREHVKSLERKSAMFQIRLDKELFDRISLEPEYQKKFESEALAYTAIDSKKQIVVTFSDHVSPTLVLRYFGRFGPLVKRDRADTKDPVHAGRYRSREPEL